MSTFNGGNFPFLDEFKNWYIEVHRNSRSAASYKSWMKKIYEEVCPIIQLKDNKVAISGQLIAENIPYFLKTYKGQSFVMDFLSVVASMSKAQNSDWGSAAMKYLIFISDLISTGYKSNSKPTNGLKTLNGSEIEKLGAQLDVKDVVYSNKDLLDIFKSRFVTQERKGGNYAHELPMRDLVQVLPGFGIWVLSFIINNVKFITSEYGATVLLKDINHLAITAKGDVIVNLKHNKGNYPLFTKTADGNIVTFKALNAKRGSKLAIAGLALDHDVSIFKILQDVGDTVPNLDSHNKGLEYNAIKLFEEFKRIHENVSFTVMDQIENVKKGK